MPDLFSLPNMKLWSNIYSTLVLAILISLTFNSTLHAQFQPGDQTEIITGFNAQEVVPVIGIHGAYDRSEGHYGIGVVGQIPATRFFRFAPGGDVWFSDPISWQANADIMIGTPLIRPGGGVAFAGRDRAGSDSHELGYNLFVTLQGIEFSDTNLRVRTYAEARWTFINGDRFFRIGAGIQFAIGSGGDAYETVPAQNRPEW
ncbi:MAG: hypothetical protein JJU46_12390 [Balneolaceae bacterium]|nr:hypothetical protein [Balneolaceae bacterium]MCH8549401.1 hypothetical protein [Balneolaceae bacterium]